MIVGSAGSQRHGRLSQALTIFNDAGVRVFGVVFYAQRRNEIDLPWHLGAISPCEALAAYTVPRSLIAFADAVTRMCQRVPSLGPGIALR